MKDTRYALGIDVGGTKIYAGVIALETGEVMGSARKRTHPERGADFFTKRLQEVTAEALESVHLPSTSQVAAIGVGLAGQVDRERGLLRGAPNLARGVEDLPLRDLLEKAFDLPVILGNDAEVATYGEQHYGAGRECDDFICVYVGTGIGSAIVQNGVLRRGATGTAGEIGHTVVQYGGRMCGCGGRGHLEAYASRSAITKVLFAELARGRTSKLQDYLKPDETAIRSKTIARCEEEKDPLMLETLSEAADYLGAGLGSLASFLNPSRIIIGGGLIEGTTFLFERASLRAREVALPVPGRALEIVRTGLGDDGGIVGAAWMAVHMRSEAES